jgi:hypothetical protein
LDESMGGPQRGPRRCGKEKHLTLAGNLTPVVQHVACHYTDLAIQALGEKYFITDLLCIAAMLFTNKPFDVITTNMEIIATKFCNIEHSGSGCNISDTYSGSARFDSRPRNRISSTRFSRGLSPFL